MVWTVVKITSSGKGARVHIPESMISESGLKGADRAILRTRVEGGLEIVGIEKGVAGAGVVRRDPAGADRSSGGE